MPDNTVGWIATKTRKIEDTYTLLKRQHGQTLSSDSFLLPLLIYTQSLLCQ